MAFVQRVSILIGNCPYSSWTAVDRRVKNQSQWAESKRGCIFGSFNQGCQSHLMSRPRLDTATGPTLWVWSGCCCNGGTWAGTGAPVAYRAIWYSLHTAYKSLRDPQAASDDMVPWANPAHRPYVRCFKRSLFFFFFLKYWLNRNGDDTFNDMIIKDN